MSGKPQPIKHGTPGGYMTHKRRGEDACNACLTAWRMYYQKYNGADPRMVFRRKRAEARLLAAQRLHQAKYKKKWRTEKRKDPEFRAREQAVQNELRKRIKAATRVATEESCADPTE